MWDWRGYITFASSIRPVSFVSVGEMAAARAAISRAYYGAYHITWSYVLEKKYPIIRDNKHATVWNELMKWKYSNAEREVGVSGSRLMGYRKKADYNDDTLRNELGRMTESAIKNALEICTLLGRQLVVPEVTP